MRYACALHVARMRVFRKATVVHGDNTDLACLAKKAHLFGELVIDFAVQLTSLSCCQNEELKQWCA